MPNVRCSADCGVVGIRQGALEEWALKGIDLLCPKCGSIAHPTADQPVHPTLEQFRTTVWDTMRSFSADAALCGPQYIASLTNLLVSALALIAVGTKISPSTLESMLRGAIAEQTQRMEGIRRKMRENPELARTLRETFEAQSKK